MEVGAGIGDTPCVPDYIGMHPSKQQQQPTQDDVTTVHSRLSMMLKQYTAGSV